MAQHAHRLAGRGAHRRLAEPLHQAEEDPLRRVAGMEDAAGEAERPDRRCDQEFLAVAVLAPVGSAELVLDQLVLGGGVGHAEQRLRQHHQRQPLAGRQRERAEEILQPADRARAGADRLDQPRRLAVDPGLRERVQLGVGDVAAHDRVIVAGVGRGEGGDGDGVGEWPRRDHTHSTRSAGGSGCRLAQQAPPLPFREIPRASGEVESRLKCNS